MKRLGAIVLSGSLVCALSFLGGNGTAAGNTPGSGVSTDTPIVTGELLNPAFFAHGAYVMQGVSDPAKTFALPLLGIPELNLLPTASGADPTTVTWSIAVSHPEGVAAEIRDDVLHIWGNSATWSGYGAVTLTANASGASGSVTIPVTVFRTDKTLVNAQGKKDYFVPWSPQLDINRVISVEEHMRKYSKDEGKLDRTIRWSHWTKMEQMRAMNCGTRWFNSHNMAGWTTARQFRTVDIVLAELSAIGVDWIKIDPCWFTTTLTSTNVVALYDYSDIPTWTDEEITYVVDEAHRLGVSVLGSLQFWSLDEMEFCGFCRQTMRPAGWSEWTRSYQAVTVHLGQLYNSIGTDMYCPGVELYNLAGEIDNMWQGKQVSRYISSAEWNTSMISVVAATRSVYLGPITWAEGALPVILNDDLALERIVPLYRTLDVLGINAYFQPL